MLGSSLPRSDGLDIVECSPSDRAWLASSRGEALSAIGDAAATGRHPTHYMINCAHPTQFDLVLDGSAPWIDRIGGLRANASTLSHAELDEMVELDDGDPTDLAERYIALRSVLPGLHVVGGCCGTDQRHVAAIANAWFASDRPSVR